MRRIASQAKPLRGSSIATSRVIAREAEPDSQDIALTSAYHDLRAFYRAQDEDHDPDPDPTPVRQAMADVLPYSFTDNDAFDVERSLFRDPDERRREKRRAAPRPTSALRKRRRN
ncbi:hypothetical protein ACFWBH_01380 [Streptomyces sp. NPDC059999]|uniref:hypothetical protein n=1 Tax=Streptomyces sp. NPDC059999 TaxID=3347030 RepID=UPI003682E30C